jgi:1-acyl-sn-glycerol-3-phosphate acyltransferase
MRKALATLLSLVYYCNMFLLLLIFHLPQVIAYNVFGYTAHKKTVDILNFLLVGNLYTLLCRPVFKNFDILPANRPLIIIANHQSMFDISPIVIGFRKNHVKFISKRELGKNLPSVSYNLRKGGSVLIDRSNGSQSIREIYRLGNSMEQKNYSACIFPEGTRTKTGAVGKFQPAGIKTLLKASPSALVVPMVIDGNYKLHKYGMFPLNIGLRLSYTALEPIDRSGYSDELLIDLVESRIKGALGKVSPL